MRRLLTCWTAMIVVIGLLSGCRYHGPCCHEHGLCDCWYVDPCVTREPWAMPPAGPGPVGPVGPNGSIGPMDGTLPPPVADDLLPLPSTKSIEKKKL